ncbi:ABC transporter substrate-binding protein [Mycobacterium sp.]|uniref:ABC transporter substrate-binding protein n=1 Tax=Mycobacterium sp. TaxID=1785 RepID=UPI002D3A85AA|nr:ABC transporter substrate-binding protein [Mycobacterium sp.]HZA12386.1 ABC transporter substrate-binding protein [Mycobacterium sp.]
MTERGRLMRWTAAGVVAALAVTVLGACSSGGATVVVNMGYQSKTINTVTAGTLLRDRGTFEAKLAELGKRTGVRYQVNWNDFASGPPLTAQMIAGKIDIGSMGDYPLLVNGSKSAGFDDVRSRLVAVTGYNLRGSLNQVVVPMDSSAQTLRDLAGKTVSVSVGSAGHGMLVDGLRGVGMNPGDVRILNQEPSVGASAIEGRQVDALAQFVPWPQVLAFNGKARLLFDGGQTGVPTFHGVIVRQRYAEQHPDIMSTFLDAMRDTTDYLNAHPFDAAQRVASITSIKPEVVYLYNGPNGLVTFDMTIKPQLVDALKSDLPFLKDLNAVGDLDLNKFVDDHYVRQTFGSDYDRLVASTANTDLIRGADPGCGGAAVDPAQSSEVWFEGDPGTVVAKSPTCLLRLIKTNAKTVRAAYVPDAGHGTRIFATTATWVIDPALGSDTSSLPFAVAADAQQYISTHPGSRLIDYPTALSSV